MNTPLSLSVGLMSGTSLDGIDAAVLATDGVLAGRSLAFISQPYSDVDRKAIRSQFGRTNADPDIESRLTNLHADAVARLLEKARLTPADVQIIGFHGQTIYHDPAAGCTVQMGDGALLARLTGIDVVGEFRHADIAAGGEGAPFAPLYHQALVERDVAGDFPLAVLNIGGVANLTWIGGVDVPPVAFDTGPGNGLIDDWVLARTGAAYDENGALAQSGTVDPVRLAKLMAHEYFGRPLPKSLDRQDFGTGLVEGLSDADGAATLSAFTARSVAHAVSILPGAPSRWLVTGGGRHNHFLMGLLADALGVPVGTVGQAGWDGDALEAEAFAYLAVRSLAGLPLSLPTTTGVPSPMTGGRLFLAPASSSSR